MIGSFGGWMCVRLGRVNWLSWLSLFSFVDGLMCLVIWVEFYGFSVGWKKVVKLGCLICLGEFVLVWDSVCGWWCVGC